MIDRKELRFGNLVLHKSVIGGPADIIGSINEPDDFLFCGQYEAIPLTQEILAKAGFEMVYRNEFWSHFSLPNKWHISQWVNDNKLSGFEEKGCFYWGVEFIPFRSLHQLQNLYYALTGNELEIKI